MEKTESRELIKSVLIMAGIPLAFSVACSLFARKSDRNISSLQDQNQETEFDSMCGDDKGNLDNSHDVNHLKEQIFTLRNKIEDLQDLEREIEIRFFRFIDLKDKEYALMEIQNSLRMEKERAEFLKREVSSMDEEKKKFDDMVIKYLKALGELESSRLENGFLQRREKKFLKKIRESWRLIRKQNSKIEALEVEMLHNQVELRRKEDMIGEFELRVEELRLMIKQLQEEKNEILNKLEAAENRAASKGEEERVLMENYNRVLNELENVQKDRAEELKQMIYLRWCHACLRHKLAGRKELEQERKADEEKVEQEVELGFGENVASSECIGHEIENEGVVHHNKKFIGSTNQRHTKRRWFVRKFKKWVDGNEKHHEAKCFGSHLVINEAEEQHSAERKSFSSV